MAAGTGLVAREALVAVGPTGTLVGLDPSAGMLGQAASLKIPLVRGFGAKTLRAAARIPYGSVRTYGDLAAQVGSPRAARAIGNALGANPIPVVVPCHRVLPAGGAVGGYGGGPERKKLLLQLEGVMRIPPARS